MTARQIIMQLYDSGELKKACTSIGGQTYGNDLMQEVLLTLFEKPEAKIIEAHEKGYFRFYVVRIVLNFMQSKNAQFHRKYRHCDETIQFEQYHAVSDDVDEQYDADADNHTQLLIDRINAAYARLGHTAEFPYEQKLLDLHLRLRNKRAVSRLTGIPYRTVCHNLDAIYQKLRNAASDY